MKVHNDNLDELTTWCWTQLCRATKDRNSEFRWLNLATVDAHGVPQVRTVVLRDADQAERLVSFHTDIRSKKLPELMSHNDVALHFHSRRHAVQMRLAGIARVASEGDRSAAWQRLLESAKAMYLQRKAPGSELTSATENAFDVSSEAENGYSNFVVIDVSISRIDWLELGGNGHRRALLTYRPGGEHHAVWLAP